MAETITGLDFFQRQKLEQEEENSKEEKNKEKKKKKCKKKGFNWQGKPTRLGKETGWSLQN